MTPRQAKVLRFIRLYQERNAGASPSLDEIKLALGIRSRGATSVMIKRLARQGRIKRVPGAHRDITLTEPQQEIAGMIWGCMTCVTHKIGGRESIGTGELHTLTVSSQRPNCRVCSAPMSALNFERTEPARATLHPTNGHDRSPSALQQET